MKKPNISVIIITFNEERNIARALTSVNWADEVIVVDSNSQDNTCTIARDLGAIAIVRDWPGYGAQKNFALEQCKGDWVLSIDADEEMTLELKDELLELIAKNHENEKVSGFALPRLTQFMGKWIRHGGWYPNHQLRVIRRGRGKWTEPVVHERLETDGKVIKTKTNLNHYSFPNIESQIETNLRFSREGFEEMLLRGRKASLVRLVVKPVGKFIETYILKAGFMDGMPGFIISINAAHSMFLKQSYFFEKENNK